MAGVSKIQSKSAYRSVFILGKPVEHSLSPFFQNDAFRAKGLRAFYSPLELETDQIGPFFEILESPNVMGANVTVPYKETVIDYLGRIERDAAWLGSVNTLYKKNGKIWGASTDGEGFLRSLGPLRRKLARTDGLLIGAGGAARAVAGALAGSGIRRLFILNRSAARAERLRKTLRTRYARLEVSLVSAREAEKLLPGLNWVVQATSLGLASGDVSPLSLKGAARSLWAADLIYHRSTAFLREAQNRRLAALNGLGMLLHQGALAFEKWTGLSAPLKVMRQSILEHLN